MTDVLVVGGGNAALCAALTAREAGASVLLLEAAPREWRGGNSQHTRNLRCMHEAPQDVLVDAYPEEEYWQDLLKVTGGNTNEELARLVIRTSSCCRDWMRSHGVHFQPPLSGALHVARTNAFFMGGGKALVNAYYRSAERLGVEIRYNSPVQDIEVRDGRFVAAHIPERTVDGVRLPAERISAKSCVLAAGGFESNREWLREAWGQNERGEWPSDNFLIRGTRFNQGTLLRRMIDLGADSIGDPTQAHMVAIDARAPLYDGGICTRIDCVSLGVVVNQEGRRFYDEGEDFWPKRYAIWGRLVAHQPGQIAYLLCFAATSVATLYHYFLDLPAPYPVFSLPVMLGIAGGIGLLAGPAGLLYLNLRRHPEHGDQAQRPMDRAFILLLFLISLTGLLLLVLREGPAMPLLALHLGLAMLISFNITPGATDVHSECRYRLGCHRCPAAGKCSAADSEPAHGGNLCPPAVHSTALSAAGGDHGGFCRDLCHQPLGL